MIPRVEELMASNPSPSSHDINEAFWQGMPWRLAEYLLSKGGADINGTPDYTSSTPLDAAGGIDNSRDTMLAWLKSKGAKSLKERLAKASPNIFGQTWATHE